MNCDALESNLKELDYDFKLYSGVSNKVLFGIEIQTHIDPSI